MFAAKILIGFVVGVMVGLTGLGGGVLLLPTMIFGLGVPPIVAVGTDMVVNAISKIGAGALHWRKRSVNWRVVAALSVGSIPGVIAGVATLAHLRALYGANINVILRELIGVLLLVLPCVMLFQGKLAADAPEAESPGRRLWPGVVVIGLIVGFLVGMTSVGSGSMIMILLLALYPFSPRIMVGTDIVHAVVLTGVASVLHSRLGTVDMNLATALLIGAIPGGLIGTQLTTWVPAHWLRRVLCGVLFITGARMLV